MFDVSQSGSDDESVRIRFGIPQAADSTKTYLEARFSRKHGLPLEWSAVIGGKPTLRVLFAELSGEDSQVAWKQVRIVNEKGEELEHWELKSSAIAEPIPAVRENWAGYVQTDFTRQDAEERDGIEQVLDHLRKGSRFDAAISLEKAITATPNQPLLQFLYAWTVDQHARLRSERKEQAVAALKVVAQSGMSDLIAMIGKQEFRFLSPAERLQVLQLQPEGTRTIENWEHITSTAIAAKAPRKIFERMLTRIAAVPDAQRYQAVELRTRLRLALKDDDEAIAICRKWSNNARGTSGQASHLATLLTDAGLSEPASELLTQAANQPGLTAEQLHTLQWQRAKLLTGMPRWRLMLASLEKIPRSSSLLSEGWRDLRRELTAPEQTEAVAQLAAAAKRPILQTALLIRQADLDPNPARAAELCWQLHARNQMPQSRVAWAVGKLAADGQDQRIVTWLESAIQKQRTLPNELLVALAEAYTKLGKATDARRALTQERERRKHFSIPSDQDPQPGGVFF